MVAVPQEALLTEPIYSSPSFDAAHGGLKSFIVILISEVGDKTFLIAAIMAMTHSRLLIFSAAISALAVMTILSAFLGQVVPSLISKKYTQLLAALLFLVFGIKMIYDATQMTGNEAQEEMEEVTHELLEKEQDKRNDKMERGGSSSPGRKPSRSPQRKSSRPDLAPHNTSLSLWHGLTDGIRNLAYLLFSPIFIQTFILTFLAEWGDRSQITTIALAGAEDFWFVTIGGLLGHSVCTGVAVLGGKMLAEKISIRSVTLMGGILFLVFGVTSLYTSYQLASSS